MWIELHKQILSGNDDWGNPPNTKILIKGIEHTAKKMKTEHQSTPALVISEMSAGK